MQRIPDNEIHGYILDILKDIDRFCTEEGLRYSMAYGTLLGAVRHKGFIPWDDDIDLMMPREDFERFVRTYNDPAGRYRCIFHVNTPEERFEHIFAKVHDTRTVIAGQERCKFGLFVDIFPVDGKPDDPKAQARMERKLTHYAHRLTMLESRFRPFNFHQPLLASLAARIMGPRHYINAAEMLMLSHDFSTCQKAGAVSMTRNGTREVFDRSLFENYTTLEFVGCRFKAFADWETFLTQQYGDYMQLPPVNQRRNHAIEAYLVR